MRTPDIIDILKVNIASGFTLGVTHAGVIRMAETVQAVGSAILIIATIGYTLWKWRAAYKEHHAE